VTTTLDVKVLPAVRDEVVRVVSGSLAKAAGSVVRVVMIVDRVVSGSLARVAGSVVRVVMIAVHVARVVVMVGEMVRRVVSGSLARAAGSVVRVVMVEDHVVRVVVIPVEMVRRVVSGIRVKVEASVARVVRVGEMIVVRVVMIVGRVVREAVMTAARVASGSRERAVGIVDRVVMIVDLVVMIAARAGTIVVMTFRRMKRSAVEPRCLPVKDHVSTAKTNRLVIGRTAKSGWLMKVRSDVESLTATNVRVVTLPAVSRVVTASRTDHCFQRHPRCRSHWRGKCVGQLVTVATSSSARSFHAPWWPTMPSVIAKHSACSRRCSKISG
jgi:hypothetical protein